jgi:CBS domain-containing protein
MQVQDVMSRDPICCDRDSYIADIARLMAQYDCGEIPVCDERGRPVGVVTDRDIVCRIIAREEDPLERRAAECMSEPVVTATPEMSIADCARLMETHQVRRLPVVDERGVCCGIIAQADLATKGCRQETADVVERVSVPRAES